MKKFPCLQDLPPTEPVDQGDEGEWDTVGEAQEEAPAEAGLVDIASILGAPTVTVVRSSL
jgi:hypothetical protein